ncbi:MAG: L,D-transpeptidase family protein [Gaiellaceae bacterium]
MRRLLLVFLPLLAVAAGGFAAAAFADTPPPATTTTAPAGTTPATPAAVAAGVVLGGVRVGGLAADAATRAVLAQFDRPLVLRIGARKVTVSPGRLGMSVPAGAAVAKALTVAANTRLGLRASFDRQLVSSYVDGLARRYDRAPVNSRLLLREQKPFVTKALPGRRIHKEPTVAALSAELVNGTRAPIAVPATTLTPTLTVASIGPVIVIERASNRLALYAAGRLVRRFPVATGQSIYPTPLGHFQIVVKDKNPWWYPPTQDAWAKGLKPVPPGPGNPLGTRWMGLDSPGVGIHGTDEPTSIGYSASHGCIRMQVPDAEWLFDHVNVGTQVFILPS